MKVVNLKGGLGNQLFQYAFGKSLQKKTDSIVKYDTSWFETGADYDHDILYLDFFKTDYRVANRQEIENLYIFGKLGKIIAERFYPKSPLITQALFNHVKEIDRNKNVISKIEPYEFKYSPAVYSTKNDAYFDGYWQASQYVKNVSNVLMEDFTLAAPISEESEEINYSIRTSESVSIHIRRGDYAKNDDTLPLDYYRKSIEQIESHLANPHYYIFSDNINWVKKEMGIKGEYTYVDHNGVKTAYEDLMLMSSCEHNIIANSTFSWWGAWLNQNSDKIVIAPGTWLGGTNTDDIDILPDIWNVISI